MLKVACVSLVWLVVFGCRPRQEESASDAKQFFENSRRRNATPEEYGPVLKLMIDDQRSCSAFLVQNSKNLPLVMTARHCANFEVDKWCEAGGKLVSSDRTQTATCEYVIASDKDLDFVLLQASGPVGTGGYRLANFSPPQGTRLKMIGFPADPFAKKMIEQGPVATDNCWVNSGDSGTTISTAKDKTSAYRVLYHNCSTYGGNSGGPLIIEDSDVVVGMPGTYQPKDFKSRKWSEKAEIEPVVDFINSQREVLRSRGVVMLDSYKQEFGEPTYRPSMKCTTTEPSFEISWLVPIYDSTSRMFGLEVKWKAVEAVNRWVCSDDLCRLDDGSTITWTGPTTFTYLRAAEGLAFDFTCLRLGA